MLSSLLFFVACVLVMGLELWPLWSTLLCMWWWELHFWPTLTLHLILFWAVLNVDEPREPDHRVQRRLSPMYTGIYDLFENNR